MRVGQASLKQNLFLKKIKERYQKAEKGSRSPKPTHVFASLKILNQVTWLFYKTLAFQMKSLTFGHYPKTLVQTLLGSDVQTAEQTILFQDTQINVGRCKPTYSQLHKELSQNTNSNTEEVNIFSSELVGFVISQHLSHFSLGSNQCTNPKAGAHLGNPGGPHAQPWKAGCSMRTYSTELAVK